VLRRKGQAALDVFNFTDHYIQGVPGALSVGVKRPGREANHSPPSSAEVKNAWSYASTPPIRLHGTQSHFERAGEDKNSLELIARQANAYHPRLFT
jgi:hypothetical protein